MAIQGNMMDQTRKWKWLSYGPPKGSGKSTFAMTSPGPKLVMQYDLGSATFPPGTKPEDFWIQTYPETDGSMLAKAANSDKWNRSKKIYTAVIQDLDAVVNAFAKGQGPIIFSDGTQMPMLPETLILDGLVRLDNIIVDGFCAINNIQDPGDAMDSRGKVGGGTQKFWGRRLSVFNKLFSLVISLPINVGAITWEDVKMLQDDKGQPYVASREPDVGGKLNVWSPGLFDACFYHYSQGGQFKVRTQPTNEIQRVGLRNAYGLDAVIDVTIDPSKKDQLLPFDRVFSKAQRKEIAA